MRNDPYLSHEDQYKEILNNNEIGRIKDPILREIRTRYWNKRHAAFLDEAGIPDQELERVTDELQLAEKREIASYRLRYDPE